MIIYTGQQIIAHGNEGSSDYLLVTFSPLYSEDDAAGLYYLQSHVERADISCIGVMTTERAFFLSREMDEVARLVRIARRGRKVIVFGQSMGGYAALKYSASLEADYVLASSPYYSVDPDELDLKSDRERRILSQQMRSHGVPQRPEFKGMGIRNADVSGRLVVIYDPAQRVDAHDVELISKRISRVEVTPAWHAGHVIYDGSWNTAATFGLLDAVRSSQPQAVRQELARLRRSSPVLLLRGLGKAVDRKPKLAGAALRSPAFTTHPDARGPMLSGLNLRLIYVLISNGFRAEAQTHFSFFLREMLGQDHEPLVQDGSGAIRHLLLGTHGAFLAYDTVQNQIRFDSHIFGRETIKPIVARVIEGRLVFSTLSNGTETEVPSNAWKVERDVVMFPPKILAHGACRLGLQTGDTFFGAGLAGELHTHPVIASQESFVAVAIQADTNSLAADVPNWFEPDPVAQTAPALDAASRAKLDELLALVEKQDRLLRSMGERLERNEAGSAELASTVARFLQLQITIGAIPPEHASEASDLLQLSAEDTRQGPLALKPALPRFGG